MRGFRSTRRVAPNEMNPHSSKRSPGGATPNAGVPGNTFVSARVPSIARLTNVALGATFVSHATQEPAAGLGPTLSSPTKPRAAPPHAPRAERALPTQSDTTAAA